MDRVYIKLDLAANFPALISEKNILPNTTAEMI